MTPVRPRGYATFVGAGIRQLWIKDEAWKPTGSFTLAGCSTTAGSESPMGSDF